MRIRWRGLELPGAVARDEAVSTDVFGRFTIEPFEQGFGATIGNSLRRVLISSLEGAAVTSLKIEGVSHEFTSIDGVLEDVTDIILNVKGIIVGYDGEGFKTMTAERTTAGVVRAGDLETDPAVTVINADHAIATLTADVSFKLELTVGCGRGYASASENRRPDQEVGLLSVDSVFSPVTRVRFRSEDMRVGQRTNYDRLILDVWTNGTITPENALVEAGLILRKHLNPFVLYHELSSESVHPTQSTVADVNAPESSALDELLDRPVSSLNLSVRSSNCLEGARIQTIRELVGRTDADLLRYRSFGKTSLQEVDAKLGEIGLSLGMKVDGGGAGPDDSMAGGEIGSELGGELGSGGAGDMSMPLTGGFSAPTPGAFPAPPAVPFPPGALTTPAEGPPLEGPTLGEPTLGGSSMSSPLAGDGGAGGSGATESDSTGAEGPGPMAAYTVEDK